MSEMSESAFWAQDQGEANQSLSDYLNSLGSIVNPQEYRKETEERQSFNQKLLAGTGAVAAPFALTGIEGVKRDVIEPGFKRLAGRTGVKLTDEGGVDMQGTVSSALKRLSPRNRLEALSRLARGDPGYTAEGMEEPVQRVVRNPNDAPDLLDLQPGEASEQFRQAFFTGQRQLDRLIRNSGDVPTRLDSDDDIERLYGAEGIEPTDMQKEGYKAGQLVRRVQYRRLQRQWQENQPEAIDDEPIQMREIGETDEAGDPTASSLQEPRQLGGSLRTPGESMGGAAAADADRPVGEMVTQGLQPGQNFEFRMPRPGSTPLNGGGQAIEGAAEEEAGDVAQTVAPKAAKAVDEATNIAKNVGKAALTASETDAEFGGPEDVLGDIVALGAGLGTLFGGFGGEKKAPTPILRTPVNPGDERGL